MDSVLGQGTLKSLHAEFEAHLRAFFMSRKERLSFGDFFEVLQARLEEYTTRPAKRIRPIMLVASYSVFGGNSISRKALLDVAVALELLHTFVLLHDDIVDRSEARRGLPAYHTLAAGLFPQHSDRDRLGSGIALVVGDMVFALALETLHLADIEQSTKQRIVGRFLSAVMDTGAGEISDIILGASDVSRASREEIERMYDLKTTRYTFQMPLELGALLAGADEAVLHSISRFSGPVGLAFQMLNDLGEFHQAMESGAVDSSDIGEGKKTLLIREAFDRLAEPDKTLLQICLANQLPTETVRVKVCELVSRSGAVECLEQRVSQLFVEARRQLESGDLTESQRAGLQDWCEALQQMLAKG